MENLNLQWIYNKYVKKTNNISKLKGEIDYGKDSKDYKEGFLRSTYRVS